MSKMIVYLILFIVIGVIGVLAVGKIRRGGNIEPTSDKIQIVLYKKGESVFLIEQSSHFKEVLDESEKLFINADNSYQLIMSEERITDIKKNQIAIEVLYPRLRSVKLQSQQSVYFTKLLIPLSGEFSNGTVFFAGAYADALGGKKPEYSLLLKYGPINFIRNTQGLDKLKEVLQKISTIN